MEWLIVWLVFGGLAAWIMSERGNSGCGGFALGMLLGPIGVLIALLIPKSDAKRVAEIRKEAALRDEARRGQGGGPWSVPGHGQASQCKRCGAHFAPTAKFCSACGEAREVKTESE